MSLFLQSLVFLYGLVKQFDKRTAPLMQTKRLNNIENLRIRFNDYILLMEIVIKPLKIQIVVHLI